MEDRLYKFARLVDAGSYTKAAKLLHISQPALTTAIQKLERELHAELLIRSSHTFTLTTAGQIAYDAAKQISTQTDNLRAQLANATNDKPRLRLGMIDGLADLLFVHGNNLAKLEHGTQLALTVDNSSRLAQHVAHDHLDLALVARPALLPTSLQVIELGEEPLVLVTGSQRAAKVQSDVLAGLLQDFLAYNQESHTYKLVEDYLSAQGLHVQHSFYSTSPQIMLQLILEGKGTAALPYLLVQPYLQDVRLKPVQTSGGSIIKRSVVGLHRVGRLLPADAIALLYQTQTQLKQLTASANKL